MAVSLRISPRKGQIQNALIIAAVVAAFAAVLPVAFAIITGIGDKAVRTAFASAPAGDYAVVSRTDGDTDIISVVRPESPGAAVEVGRIKHLPGFAVIGAVAPDGRQLAAVAADAGTPANPGASLLLLDLESGALTRLSTGIDPLQPPVWAPDSRSVVVSRAGSNSAASTSLVRVAADGSGETKIFEAKNILGIYPVAFDPNGALVSVVIDGRGSTVLRDGHEILHLSTQITRDWRLSSDGQQLAFIESDVTSGLRYHSRVVSLGGGAAAAQALTADDGAQRVGVAWRPGSPEPTFGRDPAGAASTTVTAQREALSTDSSGFDVPLAYSPDGQWLAVTHWSGDSFAQAGDAMLAVVSGSERTQIPGASRFLGWARR